MKEDNIIYVLKLNTDGRQVLQRANHQIYPTEIARGRNVFTKYEPYTREVGCQYEVNIHNFCTCKKEVMLRRPECDYFGFPKQIYAYHGPRNTDIGVGSVKALIRKRVKIYLPETDDRGVGSSDLTSFIIQKSRPPDPDSFYDQKRTSSKCVGGLEVPNTGCVLSKKLSPLIYTKSDGTSPIVANSNKNQEIGSNTVIAVTATHTPQAQHIEKKSIIVTKSKDKKSVKSFDSSKKKSKLLANSKPVDSNKDTDKDFSSDSLVQHIHNLEDLSEIRPSRLSMDVMENKIETEYRHIFSTKSKEEKPKKEISGGSDIKSASVLKRRFEALRRGLSKKEDMKRIPIGGSKESSQISRPSHKDVSIASDPPSLEARSFSSTGVYTPVPPSSRVHDKKGYNRKAIQKASVASAKVKNTLQWEDVDEDDSEIQGVQGMFELWGQKFDLEEDAQRNSRIPSPPDSMSKKPIREAKQDSPILEEKKEGRKFFFFKKKAKDKTKPYKNKKNVTAGRCELRDGLMIKIGKSQEKVVTKDIHRDVTPENYNKILRKAWFRKYLTKAIESKNSVKIRWNNKTYATSSSTVFELMDNVYKEAGVVLKSRSETTVSDSYYYDTYNRNHNVNFAHQDIEAWMIPTLTNNPKELPLKIRIRPSTELRDNIKIRISDERRSMDASKAFLHQFEVILRSQNFIKLDKKESSEYVTIDIPVGFFINSSNENYKHKLSSEEVVYNIGGYETGSEQDRVGNLESLKANNIDVKASNKVSAEMLNNRMISSPECRDVIIQGSQVFTMKRCDVVGEGVVTDTPREMRNTKTAGIKIRDEILLFGDGSSKVFTSNNKKFEIAENYLQDYYKISTPLGLELFSWCVSDSHLNCRLENSISSNNNQGDVTRSCSDILDSLHPIAVIIPSCDSPSCSQFVAFVDDDKTVEKGFNSNRKRTETSGPRMSPKDSIQVCKKRMFYAVSNKSKWNGYDVADSDQCNNTARKMANPCVTFAEKSLRQNKICEKRISMPNCEVIREAHEKQLEEVPGILVFKGKSSKCNPPNQGQKPETGHNSRENRSPCYSPRQSCSPPRRASPPKMPCCTPPKGSGTSPKLSKPLVIFLPPQNVSPPTPPSPPRLRSSPLRYPAPKGKCPQMTESPSPSPPTKTTCSPPPCPPLKGKSPPRPCSPPHSPPPKRTCSVPPCPPLKGNSPPWPCSSPPSHPPKKICPPPPCPQLKGKSSPRPCSPSPSPPPKIMCSPSPCSPSPSTPPKRTCPPRPCSPSPSPPPKRTCSPPPCGSPKGKSPQRPCSPAPSTPPKRTCSPRPCSPPKVKCPARPCSPQATPPPKITCPTQPCPLTKGTISPPPRPPPKGTCSPKQSTSSPCSPPKKKCSLQPSTSPPLKGTPASLPCSPAAKKPHSPPPCPLTAHHHSPSPCSCPPTKKAASSPPSPSSQKVISCPPITPPKNTCSSIPCLPPANFSSSCCSLFKKSTSCCTSKKPPPPCKSLKKSLKKCNSESPCASLPCICMSPPKKSSSPCSSPKTSTWSWLKYPSFFPKKAGCPPKKQCPKIACGSPKPCPPPLSAPGIHIEVIPNVKKNCCKNNIPESEPDDNCCIRLSSKEKLTIRMRTQSASTEEIREGFNIKVQDDDGKTLYERRDYSKPENTCTPVSHGNVYNSSMNIRNVHRVPTKVLSESSKFKKSYENEIINQDKSETNVANLIEVQFQMRVSHGDEAAEISIENDAQTNDKVENNDIYNINIPNDGCIVKNEPNVCIENKDPKNDINIRILIKTFKTKDKKDISTNEYSRKISEKFRTVSTGYSTNLCNKIDEKMFSVHRTTVDLTTPDDKSKTHMTHGKLLVISHSGIRSISTVKSTGKPGRTHSEIIIGDLPRNHEGKSDMDQNKKYIYDSLHSMGLPNIDHQQNGFTNSFCKIEKGYISDKEDITEKTDLTEKTDYTDKDDYAVKDDLTEKDDLTTERDEFTEREDYTEKDDLTDNYLTEDSDAKHLKDHDWTMKDLDKVYHNVRKNKSFEQNYKAFLSTDTDDQDLVLEANTSNEQDATLSIGLVIKPHTKEEKKEMLKDIFEKTHDMEGNKAQMKQIRDMLKNILTSDSSEHENLHMKSNELAKDVTFASLNPNYFKGSDSMTNYYNVDGDSVSLKDSKIRPNCSVYSKGSYLSSDNDGRRNECMCRTLATRLEPTKFIRGGGCCCCSKPVCLKDEEVACDIKSSDSCNLISKTEGNFVDVEIQHSKLKAHTSTDISVHSYNRSKLNIIETCNVVQYEEITANVMKTEIQRTRNRQSKKNRIIQASSMKVMHNNILKISDRTVMSAVNPPDDEIDVVTCLIRGSDILQSYEAKKAVLEIYAEKTICKDGEHLIAKLPKFVYDRESEIEMNYEAIASNSYKSTFKNSGIKPIKR